MSLFKRAGKSIRSERTLQQKAGDRAEDIACQYLQQQGLKLIARNYLCRYGEIDLIMQATDGPFESLVFVEVRHRKAIAFGSSLESINYQKQQKLRRTAKYYLSEVSNRSDQSCRFDVISIDGVLSNDNIIWVKNAI